MKIVAIVGSLRKDSLNMQLVKTIEKRYGHLFEVEIADIGNLPFYNEDEENSPSEIVQNYKKMIAEADAVIISTPEFNWSMSGVLKNALEWLSRVDKPIVGKPVLPMGVSQGVLGTVRAQMHLRQVLQSIQATTLPPAGNEIFIGSAGQKFLDGGLRDEGTLKFLDQVVDKFITFVKEQEIK
ncbi:NAD(P)H-dependent oxidoreductase [Sporosarcina sp. ANT_H38]|uniref:NADPH-dependent FMN reductase n=1 Tax=Sporosarcina sp. ANT_H38 TaxID=2597358 RepID=UPI0011F3F2BD|nr:NADPH-dependent FMN reductase [Sporosarcina sp. ANT_H38]KAA0955902.1 NAD(P)H-dependent oxidoreductase [Sporosarcina sp. ANT_H38]